MVPEKPFERTPFVGTRIDDIEQLKQHQGRECHGLRVGYGAGAFDFAADVPGLRIPGRVVASSRSLARIIPASERRLR